MDREKAIEELNKVLEIEPNESRKAAIREGINALHETNVKSHSEERMLRECIGLMKGMIDDFAEWYDYMHREGSVEEIGEDEKLYIERSYVDIVRPLFLAGTNHSGGMSSERKCVDLGVDPYETITFGFRSYDDEE